MLVWPHESGREPDTAAVCLHHFMGTQNCAHRQWEQPESSPFSTTPSKRHSHGHLGVRKWPFPNETFGCFFTVAIISLRWNSIAEIPYCITSAASENVIRCKPESYDHKTKWRKLSKIWPMLTSLNWRTHGVVLCGADVAGLWHNTLLLMLVLVELPPFPPPAWSDTTVGSAW